MKTLADNLIRNCNHLIAQGLCLGHGTGFRINADDGLRVGLAEVHPGLVGLKVDLYAVYVVDVFLGVDNLELAQDFVDEFAVAQLDLVLGDICIYSRGR